ncbi:MAG TPA: DUF262 domain-containing protein [bacterium]|nr:DUF262 domain-containing protein [bacterium]
MSSIKAYPMQNSAILRINSEKEFIDIDPWYQRQSDVWTLEKKQLLIDSILNEFDIPKLYFHVLLPKENDSEFDFAVIDGRQRLESIWDYMNDEFPLSDEFEFFKSEEVDAKGLTYSDLASKYPKLKIRFDSFSLPIICVETDDIDLIEDMFSRLNEAVPLNAAEKRNAIGGPMAKSIREIALHHFFQKKVKFGNKRYQHREVAAKLMFLEFSLHFKKKIVDTKKPYLDDMVKKYKNHETSDLKAIETATKNVLDELYEVFIENDDLLKAQTMVPIFYLAMKRAIKSKSTEFFTRPSLIQFFSSLKENREMAEKDIAKANFELLEFDRMSQQGSNDAVSIDERVRTLCKYLRIDNFIEYLKGLGDEERQESLLSDKLREDLWDIDSYEAVSSAIAITNATGFYIDEFEVDDFEISNDEVEVHFSFHMTGDQTLDKPFHGDKIQGDGSAVIDGEKNIEIEIHSAEVISEY